MRKTFSEHVNIWIPVCKVPKNFDIEIHIRCVHGESLSCQAVDNIKHVGTYKRCNYIKYIPRISTVFILLREVLIDTFLLIRGK